MTDTGSTERLAQMYNRRKGWVSAILKQHNTTMTLYGLQSLGDLEIYSNAYSNTWRFPIQLIPPGRSNYGPASSDVNYVLLVDTQHKWRYAVQEEGYDLHGSHVFKVGMVRHEIDYVFVTAVCLIGKEYTGQWWLHYLPPFYANAHIPACERWILNISKTDELVMEA